MPDPIAPAPVAPAPAATPTITFEALSALQDDAFRNVLPEEIRGQGWMKDVNTFGDFVKKSAGAQALIGQRAVPLETDPPEKWNAWYAQIGRPEKPEAYGIPKIDGVPDEYIKNTAEVGVLHKVLHAGGANPVQAKAIMSQLIKHIYTAEQTEAAEAEKAHNAFMDKTFGKDRQTIIDNGKKYLATVLTPELNAVFAGMTDQQMAVTLALTDAVARKFGQEDSFRGGQGAGGGGGAETMETLTAQMREIMGQKEYQDPFLNRNKHLELNQKMQSIRDKMQKLSVKS